MENSSKQVAAYCRVSTLEQKKNGLGMDIQVREVSAFADAQNLAIDRMYRDEAQSGATENRRQLKKLLRACQRGLVGTIIIPTLDRLSRDLRIAENLFWQFQQLGIKVLIVDMPYYNSGNRRDVLVRQIREAIAEDNRKEIIERLCKGRQERVRKGNTPGGTTPYGFRRSKKRLVPDTTESTIIRTIFELSKLGYSSSEIAKELSEQGHLQRNRQPWAPRQVRTILSRRTFYESGVIRYGNVEGINKELVLVRTVQPDCAAQREVGVSL